MSEKGLDNNYKNSLFDEFIAKPDGDRDKIGYFSHFFSYIKGTEFETELMTTKYSIIKHKFTDILNALNRIEDGSEKSELFSNLISSIRRTRLLEEDFSTILETLDKIDDGYEKRSAFVSLIYSIEETRLLEENFTAILNSLDKIDGAEKKHAFSSLIYSIKETSLLEINFTAILNSLDKIKYLRRSAFYDLISVIKRTHLLEENLTHIKEQFPEYSDELEKILKKKESS